MRKCILAVLMYFAATGCIDPNAEPIERYTDRGLRMMEEALAKAATELSSQSGQWVGTGAVIDPGYKITAIGIVGTGFIGESTIRLQGVSGTLGTATQVGPPSRNVDNFGDSLLPPTEPVPDPE